MRNIKQRKAIELDSSTYGGSMELALPLPQASVRNSVCISDSTGKDKERLRR
jgi:hypothetical protein